MRIPSKLRAIWYILRGYGVIYRVRIGGITVYGQEKLFVYDSKICPPDSKPIEVGAYKGAPWHPPKAPYYPV